jgi:hypothetical protein
MASKVIITGENFGEDPGQIHVYFNRKRASVVKSLGDKMYILVPRQPGDTCTLSVKVGQDSVVFPGKFYYHTRYMVTTIAGQPGSTTAQEGSLATATFVSPQFIAVDDENNVFVSDRISNSVGECSVLNESTNMVTRLVRSSNIPSVPTVEGTTQRVFVPDDVRESYYEMDPADMWAPRRRQMLHPSAEQQAAGMLNYASIDYKHSFAFCAHDGMIYTYVPDGQIVKFSSTERVGQLVHGNIGFRSAGFMVFDLGKPHLLYICCRNRSCIYTYDLLTDEFKLFAGAPNVVGWNDGAALDAEFNTPNQITVDREGNLYVADAGNHCIRMISPEGIVTTPIGIHGQPGYMDGDPEVALLNYPTGVAVDRNGDVYIVDSNNKCVRRLTIQ